MMGGVYIVLQSDARTRLDSRPIALQRGVITNTTGSCQVMVHRDIFLFISGGSN